MLLLQILLIPFKLVIKLIFLILTGIVKLTSLPFKLVSLLASMFTGLLGGGIAVIGVGFTASGFMGQISTENWLFVGLSIIASGVLIFAIPYIGMAIADLLDDLSELIWDGMCDLSVLPI